MEKYPQNTKIIAYIFNKFCDNDLRNQCWKELQYINYRVLGFAGKLNFILFFYQRTRYSLPTTRSILPVSLKAQAQHSPLQPHYNGHRFLSSRRTTTNKRVASTP